MKKRIAPLLIGAVVAAGSALAQTQAQAQMADFSDAELAKFVSVVVSKNCHMTDKNAAEIASETGLSDQKLQAILTHFIEADKVKPDGTGKGIVLLNKECS